MMISTLLKNWKGAVEIDGTVYDSVQDARSALETFSDEVHIKLLAKRKSVSESAVEAQKSTSDECRVTVKKYMTEKASPSFDFMKKWNNDVPMPLRTMIGIAVKETKGMVYMKLHGQAEPVIHCMRCGRLLTNETSKLYGIGPECITKIPMLMSFDVSDVSGIKKKLVDVTWEGWIIKSAITEREAV